MLSASVARAARPEFDETTQFIFYSVLEGLYDDGVSTEDVEQILMRNEGEEYFHFIYACPVCMASIWALDAYRARPESMHSVKGRHSTFGEGLEKDVQNELYSEDPKRRLSAINGLINRWIEGRMAAMNLTDEMRETLLDGLEAKRKKGMEMLQKFHDSGRPKDKGGVAYYAPAYAAGKQWECAACNGAVGKAMAFGKDEKK